MALCNEKHTCADPEKFLRGGGGFQIPRRDLKENFNMAKINNLAIPGGGGGSGPPVPPSGSAHGIWGVNNQFIRKTSVKKLLNDTATIA